MQRQYSIHRQLCLALGAVLMLGLAGCGEEGPFEISDVRSVKRVPDDERAVRTSRQRFLRETASRNLPGPGSERPTYTWDTPEGWAQVAVRAMQMRDASFTAPGDVDVSLLVGRPSGLLMNVNRWRAQMGVDPVDEAALGRLRFAKGLLVDLTGTFTGGKGGGVEGQRFLGYLRLESNHLLSVRALGAADAVSAQLDAFKGFVRSLSVVEHVGPAHPPRDQPEDDPLRKQLAWDTPDGWTSTRAESGMRLASFRIDGAPKLDVPLIALRIEPSGLEANLDMWADNVGRAHLTDEEIKAFERFDLLGGSAMFVELHGSRALPGDDAPVDTALLGLVCFIEGRALFLRLLGPTDDVIPHKDAFVALGRSLRMEG